MYVGVLRVVKCYRYCVVLVFRVEARYVLDMLFSGMMFRSSQSRDGAS